MIDKEGNIQFKLLDEGKNENFENISNEAFNSIGDKFKVTYASNFFNSHNNSSAYYKFIEYA